MKAWLYAVAWLWRNRAAWWQAVSSADSETDVRQRVTALWKATHR